jgi:nucleoside-diphosphate-sugar epimerase
MRVLIVGGTGFIGPHVARELQQLGHDVAVFHRGQSNMDLPVEHLLGDWSDLPALRPRADVVIDMILSSQRQAQGLVDAFRGIARRVIAVSSCDVYRACGVLHGLEDGPLEPVPLTEESALRSKEPYPKEQIVKLRQLIPWLDEEYDKIPAEKIVMSDPEIAGTVLRLPMVYGPGDFAHRFHGTLKRIDDARRAIILEQGLADWRAPRGYVENVAHAIALAVCDDRATGRTYNVAETPVFTELEWAKKIAAATGWSGDFVVLPPERTPAHLRFPGNSDQHWEVDSSLIRSELGYREIVPIEEGIRRTIEWERAHPPGPVSLLPPFDYVAEDAALAV